MTVVSLYILLSLFIILTSGYALNRLFGSHETRFLEKEITILSNEMRSLFDKGRQISQSLTDGFFVRDNTYRTILQMDTVDYSIRLAGTGGSANERELVVRGDITYQVNDMLKMLNNQLQLQSGSIQVLDKKAEEYAIITKHMPAILPVAAKDLIEISTDFGIRSDPFFFVSRNHSGLDFVAPPGKNVYATGDGIVTFVNYSRTGYGNEIVIDHQFELGTRYGHLQKIFVKDGERVKRGQIIGLVGETGRATGPHLHYEVLYRNQPVNPSLYFDTTSLTKEEFAQIIDQANK